MPFFCRRFLTFFWGRKNHSHSFLDHVPWKGMLGNCFSLPGNAGQTIFAEKCHFRARNFRLSKIMIRTKNMQKRPCRKWPFLRKSHFPPESKSAPIWGYLKNRLQWDKLTIFWTYFHRFQFPSQKWHSCFSKTSVVKSPENAICSYTWPPTQSLKSLRDLKNAIFQSISFFLIISWPL